MAAAAIRRRQTDRRQTDGRARVYSERERQFTFAKNLKTQIYKVYKTTQTQIKTNS